MSLRLRVLAAFLRRRGGMLGCDNFADVISFTIIGLPPHEAVERALDLQYPERVSRRTEKR